MNTCFLILSFLSLLELVSANRATSHFASQQTSLSECLPTETSCKISATEKCAFNTLTKGSVLNYIVPGGGKTGCMNSTYPFQFSVQVGSSKNDILFYFQGGGACTAGVNLNECNVCTVLGTREGIINAFDSENLFRNYTIIEIFYCSGDLHIGNKDAPFFETPGKLARFAGQENVLSVLRWVREQQNSKFLPKEFDNLVLAGSSAGAEGVQYWSNLILSTVLL
jgi:hypothetical protein